MSHFDAVMQSGAAFSHPAFSMDMAAVAAVMGVFAMPGPRYRPGPKPKPREYAWREYRATGKRYK